MHNIASLTEQKMIENPVDTGNINSLVVELEHYRRQSEWLTRVNELHARLAGAVDLPAMIEAFSIWLMPLVSHDLIAYNNPERQRTHMFCSCHGPERRQVMKAADRIFNGKGEFKMQPSVMESGYYFHTLGLKNSKGGGLMLVLRKSAAISDYESEVINKGMKILQEPLMRALEYEDLYEQASRDSLTGLANRRVFEERIGSILDSAKRHGHKVSLACMDLDRFKQINDSYGHMVGDLVLQKVARVMERMVRSCDLLVRMGGDEFMLVMSNTNLDEAEVLANRLCQTIDELDLPVAGRGQLGISIGLLEWHQDFSRDEWIQQADEALYRAKEEGRSRVYAVAS